jgi:hypothetical protein
VKVGRRKHTKGSYLKGKRKVKPSKNLALAIKAIADSRLESKSLYVTGTLAAFTPGTDYGLLLALGNLNNGQNDGFRIGDQVHYTWLNLKMTLNSTAPTTNAETTWVRLMLFRNKTKGQAFPTDAAALIYKDPRGTAMTAATVRATYPEGGVINLPLTNGQYEPVWQKTVSLAGAAQYNPNPRASSDVYVKNYWIPINRIAHWDDATLASSDTFYYLIAQSFRSRTAPAGATFQYTCYATMFFKDG